jgi:hypothetical protein
MTLMSLILWCSPSGNLQVVLMLRHYIIWSLFKFLYRFLHWIFICNAHVIHIRLIHPVRRLTRLECRILNLWWLFPTDTPVVIAKCGISQVRRRIHSQPPMIWIPLENLDLTPLDLLTSRLQNLLKAYRWVGWHWIRGLLGVVRARMLSVYESVISLGLKAGEEVLETF